MTAVIEIYADTVANEIVLVHETDGLVDGVGSVGPREHGLEVTNLWVEPSRIGQGIGRRLLAALVDEARAMGATAVLIESDPNAEGFYVHLGATRTGTRDSAAIPGRTLPLLRLDCAGGRPDG